MKKAIFENFKYAMLPKSATRMITGGAYCQVISCAAGVACTVSNNGKTECCGDKTGSDCWHATVSGPGGDQGSGN